MDWQIIESPKASGQENMAIDRKLFHDFEKDLITPTFRIYGWSNNCVSIGYSQKLEDIPSEYSDWEKVKRPTGGGIVFHTPEEVTYCVVGPKDKNLMETYYHISEIILKALQGLGFPVKLHKALVPSNCPLATRISNLCFEQPMEYEITLGGKKIVGSAQRRGRNGFLQQGTIKVEGLKRAEIIKSLTDSILQP